jgi:GTP-binding protein
LKRNDIDMLELLHSLGAPHQIVLSKTDRVLYPRGFANGEPKESRVKHLEKIVQETQQKIRELRKERKSSVLEEIVCTSADVPGEQGEMRLGLNTLRFSIYEAAGLGLKIGANGAEELAQKPLPDTSGLDSLEATAIDLRPRT